MPTTLFAGLFVSCAGGFLIRERIIGRAVQEADKLRPTYDHDEDDLDQESISFANRVGFWTFAAILIASIFAQWLGIFGIRKLLRTDRTTLS